MCRVLRLRVQTSQLRDSQDRTHSSRICESASQIEQAARNYALSVFRRENSKLVFSSRLNLRETFMRVKRKKIFIKFNWTASSSSCRAVANLTFINKILVERMKYGMMYCDV